jgi:hypothetical protein
MDIDAMTPDELRRRLREALRENEALRRRMDEYRPASPVGSLASSSFTASGARGNGTGWWQ